MRFQIQDETGHSEIDFSKRVDGDAAVLERYQVVDGADLAKRLFAKLVDERKMTPARRREDGTAEVIRSSERSFNPGDETVLFIRPFVGG